MKRIRSPILLLLFLLLSVWGRAQYLGGDGEGGITTLLVQASCSAPVYPSIFNGGSESGATLVLVQQASCSAVAMPAIFAGGNENSLSSLLVTQVSCSAATYPSIFTGGVDSSGNAADLPQVSCSAPVYPSIFNGGVEDGYSGTPVIQVACTTPADPGIYAGGNSNVSTEVTFLTACAPYAEFEADTLFVCEGDTVFFTDLSLGNPTLWNWSFDGGTPMGSSLQNPFVIYNTAGTYQVQLDITAPNGNSTELKPGYIVVGARPSATITASGPVSFCGGDSVQLSVTPAYPAYSWNSGQITQSVYASATGSYFSVITAANGCTANTDTVSVNVLTNPVPLVTASGPTTLCNDDTLTLTSSPGASYLWLPGSENTQALEVTASGTYYVSVTYPNGCSNVSAPVNAVFGTTPATPVISASGPLSFCNGDSVILTSSPASSYLWSPGAGTGQTITVKNSGTYYVETGNGSGCTALSSPITVTVLANTPTPAITASGPLAFCSGDSVVLTSSPAATYDWSPGAQTTQSITVTASGTYFVEADNGNNCPSVSIPVSVTVNAVPATPTISASGPLTFCNGGNVTLTASAAGSYLWYPGGQTTQSITVSATGNYYVETGNGTGCTASSTPVSVTVNAVPATPAISASGPLTFCSGGSVTLTSTAASSYLWYPNGETTQSIAVSATGNYYVETGNGTGCTASAAPVSVTVNAVPTTPTISASGPLTFCNGGSVTLTASAAGSYLWYPGGQTTQSITVSATGNYYVETGNGTGCTASSTPVSVTVNTVPATPAISASGPLTFCSGGSVTLTSTAASSYLWYPNGETTQSITVSATGSYYVETGNGTGCTASAAPVSVTVNAVPATPTISASGPLTFCNGGSVTLTATAASSYLWYPNGETTQSITVSATGNYYVETGNGTGCTASSTPVSVTVNTGPSTPIVNASGPVTFCTGDSVVLTASVAGTYLWYPGGQTTQSITVYNSGNFYVETDNGTTCTAVSAQTSVTVNPVPAVPTVTASGPVTFCAGDSVVLTASAAGSYLWYPGGQTTQSITVSTTGNYYVEAGNGTGCTASSVPVSVTVNSVPSVPVISASGTLTFCDGDSVVLTSTAAGSYLWYPGGETTQSITVSASGNYYVETGNGSCTAQSTVQAVSVLPRPAAPVVSASGSLVFCEGDSVVLTSSLADSYLWNPSGETTQSLTVDATGTYFVEVTNASGCTNSSTPVSVVVNPNPAVNLSGSAVACLNTTEIYTTTNLGSVSYFWTIGNATVISGSGTNSVSVLFPDTGLATVEVIVSDLSTSCFSQADMSVLVLDAPDAYAGADVSVCQGTGVFLNASGGTTYSWSPQTGLSDPSVSNPFASPVVTTSYVVEVANGSCTDSDTILVTVNPVPVVDAGSDVFISDDTCAVLAGSGSGVSTILWSPAYGLSDVSVFEPVACPDTTTMYYITVTSSFGCSATDSVTVYVSSSGDELIFPNTFTPNGDGTNDVWHISGLEQYPGHRLTVFNRWGNQVFDAQPYENNWDGTSLGRELPDGTYFYVFDKGNGEELLKGYLMIIR